MRTVYFAILMGIFCLTTAATCQKTTEPLTTAKAEVVKKKGRPYMTFEKKHIKLGEVKKGEKRSFDYVFTNTGDTPLEIDIITACECSTLDYSTKAVAPNDSGKISVIFDSSEKEASETIDITIVLKNVDERSYPLIEEISYDFELLK